MNRPFMMAAALALAAPSIYTPAPAYARTTQQRTVSETHQPAKRRAAKRIKKASQKRNRK